ncbi:MAG: hypothetical protein SFY95_06670, partial [Planctomycetota bacterium]|nr:hypothetical protein [Planctomycetota bacterium]
RWLVGGITRGSWLGLLGAEWALTEAESTENSADVRAALAFALWHQTTALDHFRRQQGKPDLVPLELVPRVLAAFRSTVLESDVPIEGDAALALIVHADYGRNTPEALEWATQNPERRATGEATLSALRANPARLLGPTARRRWEQAENPTAVVDP